MTLSLPHSEHGRHALQAVLDDPSRALFATDFDGVLAEIVDDPDHAAGDEAAMAALGRIGLRVRQVVVITGRPAMTAVRLGRLRERPGLERLVVLGQYGVERWDADTDHLVDPPTPEAIESLAAELPELLARLGLSEVRVEDKGRARVVHTRRLPDPGGALRRLREPVAELAERHGLLVEPGKNVLEIRAAGQDKGQALRAIMAETSAACAVYIGDDLGDLPAFEAIRTFQTDGVPALGICSASVEQDALVAVSDLVVDGVPGVAGWLTELADALEGQPGQSDQPGQAH